MILLLHGPDTYRSKQRLRVLRDAFREKYDKDGQSIVRLHGAELTLEKFRQAVHTTGLFSQRRCIIVEEAIGLAKASVQQELLTALESDIVPKDNVVIFWEAVLPARGMSPLQKFLQKQKAENFDLLNGRQLGTWISTYLRDAGAKITPAAVHILVERIGPDLWQMRSELEKLIALAGEGEINVEQASLSAEQAEEVKVFAFSDALAARNVKKALLELDKLLYDGTHPLALVQMIARQLQTLLLVKEAAQDTNNSATIAKRLSVHPFVAKKSLAQVQRFQKHELLHLHERLVELDHKLKSSRVDPAVLLQEYVLGFRG